MNFSYWDSLSEEPLLTDKTAFGAWRREDPQFRIFQDADVVPILTQVDADFPALFHRIRIPACRADVARLALLWCYGGLYVDAHAGPGRREDRLNILQRLGAFDLVLFDRTYDHTGHNPLKLTNSLIAARKDSPCLRGLLERAMANLRELSAAEARTAGHVPYNIYLMTGPRMLRQQLFDEARRPYRLRPEFQRRVWLEPLASPQGGAVNLYSHQHYRRPGRHWTERQRAERLFENAPHAGLDGDLG
jgi:mannosyltransferase OCH1-like enzyme